jgi:hypothetical protein
MSRDLQRTQQHSDTAVSCHTATSKFRKYFHFLCLLCIYGPTDGLTREADTCRFNTARELQSLQCLTPSARTGLGSDWEQPNANTKAGSLHQQADASVNFPNGVMWRKPQTSDDRSAPRWSLEINSQWPANSSVHKSAYGFGLNWVLKAS